MLEMESSSKKTLLQRFRVDPVYHIEMVQGVSSTEPYQRRVIQSVADHERTVVRACHAMGKTWLAAKVVLWFTTTFPGSKVITTAPTFNQVKRLLWSEIRAGYARSKYPLGGEMLSTEWKISDDWFAIGFTSRAEHTEGEGQGAASTFQGFHAPALLVVFDEAVGIPLSIWKQMEGLMTSGFVRFLGIANPTTKSCEFAKCFSDPSYKKIHLGCFDSPNFPANDLHNMGQLTSDYYRLKELTQDEQYEELQKYQVVNNHFLTVKWVMQMVLKWGLDHPLVLSKCFGEFPDEDEYTLMSMADVQSAMYRTYAYTKSDRVSIGVDVARHGSDKTVIHVIIGSQITQRKVMVKRDTNQIVGELVRILKELHLQEYNDIHVAIDATGVGSGVVDSLKEKRDVDEIIRSRVEIREVHVGSGPGGEPGSDKEKELKKKYMNLKSRIFIELAEDLKETICLPEEDIYLEELPTIRYKFDSKGRWQIESKDEYKTRTGRASPDDADSLALANYARYDAPGVGNFGEDLIQSQNGTIINHAQGDQPQW